MTPNPIARDTETGARLELIKQLADQVATAPAHSPQHRTLNAAIRVEAAANRRALDIEQATATHDPKPQPAGWRRSFAHTTNGRAWMTRAEDHDRGECSTGGYSLVCGTVQL